MSAELTTPEPIKTEHIPPQSSASSLSGVSIYVDAPTHQPEPVYIAPEVKEDENKPKTRGYQRDQSECSQYLHSNFLEVLDLPDLNTIFCLCCSMCANTCCSSGVSAAKK
ncbi:hypothetical protein DAMA08_001940 [Martiniozyma asiatica (nom. inval.)]|nr:hypothetical protein DAMA08_001940 [Martiniozyma asiatica]